MITIPESRAFYWSDTTNKAAVNVLADFNDAPPDLTLAEVERFEVALLAADRIRLDLWRLLRSIWSATWEATMRSEFPSARLLTYGGHSNYAGEDWTPSITQAWSNRTTYGLFDVPRRGMLLTRIRLIGNDQDLEVSFSFADQKEDWTLGAEVDLGSAWTLDEGG